MKPIIHRYRSGANGLYVNSYLVESDEAIVAVDAPLLISDGRALRARLEALHKPLAAVLITHPHPDHYNTITELVAGDDVPIVALADVDHVIRRDDDMKRAKWSGMFGEEWPKMATFPNTIAKAGEVVEYGGLRFVGLDFGPCESESETIWVLEGAKPSVAFVGDLVFGGTHVYLSDGATAEWIAALNRAETELGELGVEQMLLGHGDPAGLDQLATQRAYLLFVREAINRISGGKDMLDDEGKAELTALLEAYAPEAELSWLIGAGCDAVAAELAKNGINA